jgi:hypothetical protein
VETIDINCHVDGFERELKLLRFFGISTFGIILMSLTHLPDDLLILNRQPTSFLKQAYGQVAGARRYVLPI